MPTNIQVKTDIDTDITNKTLPSSVTNTNVGVRMKSVVDYTDQELALKQNSDELSLVAISGEYNDLTNKPTIVTKILKTTITSAEILNLFTTPKVVLTSIESGKVKLPINIYIKRNAGNSYTLSNNTFQLLNSSNNVISSGLTAFPLTTTSDSYFTSSVILTQYDTATLSDSQYILKASVGNPTGGTGNIDVYITYIEITL